jgi:hypothetical protein
MLWVKEVQMSPDTLRSITRGAHLVVHACGLAIVDRDQCVLVDGDVGKLARELGVLDTV